MRDDKFYKKEIVKDLVILPLYLYCIIYGSGIVRYISITTTIGISAILWGDIIEYKNYLKSENYIIYSK